MEEKSDASTRFPEVVMYEVEILNLKKYYPVREKLFSPPSAM